VPCAHEQPADEPASFGSSAVERLIVRSRRVVFPEGVRSAAIHIDQGRIRRIAEFSDIAAAEELYDAGDLVVSPGIVDTHVHVNEPGRTDWEGFESATRAAAAGGVTTIVDMPLNSVPATTMVAALEEKRAAARGRCHVDVGFWGGIVPGNSADVDPLVDAGVRGFKCFLAPSGVEEFPHVREEHLRAALPRIAARRVPLLVHAELPEYLEPFHPTDPPHPTYLTYLSSRSPRAEVEAIRLMVRLAAEFGARVHIVHVACADALADIAAAKHMRVAISAETCPHYLTFAAEHIADDATEFKCAPPIREGRHRDRLWGGLTDGTLDLIASDHSPAPPAMKNTGDFASAWGGIASLELSLAAVWTEMILRQPEHAALREVARWMCEAPAHLAGLDGRKGRIAPGFDADLCVWNPDVERVVDAQRLQQRHKVTPYAGRRLRGDVRATILGGRRVWNGDSVADDPVGQLL
jgi:allantoinase